MPNMHTVFEKQKVMVKEKYGIDVPDFVFFFGTFSLKSDKLEILWRRVYEFFMLWR